MEVPNARGMIITVGGKQGLQNEDPYDPATVINVSLGDPNPIRRPLWTNYGICSGIAYREFNPGELGFQVAVPPTKFPCEIVLKDSQGRAYRFKIKSEPPYTETPSTDPIIDCTAPTSETVPGENWCATVRAKTNPPHNYIPKSYVEAGPPVPFP
jgi:hypothetical protein